MYIFKNAMRCIVRSKGRSILIGAVVLLLSVSSCIGLSIKQANKTLKKQYADNMEISATLNSKDMRSGNSADLDTLNDLADNKLVKNFYYSSSVYFAAGDGIEPLDVSGDFGQNKDFKAEFGDIKNGQQTTSTVESATGTANTADASAAVITLAGESSESGASSSESASSTEENSQSGENNMPTPPENSTENSSGSTEVPQMPSGDNGGGQGGQGGNTFITNNFFFNMASMNDFTVTSYSSTAAMPEYISELDVIDNDSEDLNCVISENLADENDLAVGDTFTLKNPDNEDETYTFTIVGLCDTSESTDSVDTSSNASFTDNCIYVSDAAMQAIVASSASVNETSTGDNGEEESDALTPTYGGTFIFANLNNYNKFSESLDDNYTLVSTDVSNYEQSVSQLETLSKYATYFLIVIFIIGAFVLIIINLFSIRNRKYEIGVLTAIGMKKYKVASQFVIELFVITFAALIIGSGIGAAASVPVTNSLLTTINTTESESSTNAETSQDKQTPSTENSDAKTENGNTSESSATSQNTPPSKPDGGDNKSGGMMSNFAPKVNNYIASVNSATDITVILQMILVGMGLTLVSSLAAVAFVMRYEPLKILSNRD